MLSTSDYFWIVTCFCRYACPGLSAIKVRIFIYQHSLMYLRLLILSWKTVKEQDITSQKATLFV